MIRVQARILTIIDRYSNVPHPNISGWLLAAGCSVLGAISLRFIMFYLRIDVHVQQRCFVFLCFVSFSVYCLISFRLLFCVYARHHCKFWYKNLVIYTHANIITLIHCAMRVASPSLSLSLILSLTLTLILPPTAALIKSCGSLWFLLWVIYDVTEV